MAISDTKKDVLLGQSVETQVKNIDDNFTTLFDNDDDLQSQISTKEPAFTKKTAFNKDFATTAPAMDGAASAGSAATVARGDHKHPTDTSRLAVKPDGKNTLLDENNKVRVAYLPDTVVGQLYYKGTFDATAGVTGYTAQRGDYYICSKAGTKNPDGTGATASYAVGDWAVFNGTSWDKVDNTDAVTMVNGQIGSVKTYKGTYSSAAKYYQGDIVLSNSCLYLFINGTPTAGKAVTETDYWQIFGKVYSTATTTADGLMSKTDKSNVDANTNARHSHSNKALLDSYKQTEANLADAVSKKHSHSNQAILDTYDQTNANIKDAVTKKHSHSNKSVLDATTASYTTAEKTKLGKIDDSLLDVTADDIGKVKDVKVNGTSVLGTDGVASITVADLAAGFVSVSTTDSVWTTKEVNGTTYQAIKVAKTDTALGVFNSDNQEIVVQKVYDGNYLYLCVGATKIACTIRKLSGGAVGGGGGVTVINISSNSGTFTATELAELQKPSTIVYYKDTTVQFFRLIAIMGALVYQGFRYVDSPKNPKKLYIANMSISSTGEYSVTMENFSLS